MAWRAVYCGLDSCDSWSACETESFPVRGRFRRCRPNRASISVITTERTDETGHLSADTKRTFSRVTTPQGWLNKTSDTLCPDVYSWRTEGVGRLTALLRAPLDGSETDAVAAVQRLAGESPVGAESIFYGTRTLSDRLNTSSSSPSMLTWTA